MSTESRATGDQVMQAFASLRLTMFLLICLAVVSIIGTIIPQGQLPPEYLASIGGEQGNRFKLYSLLGFFDMYHSWWFVGLLTTLTLNLLACTLKREDARDRPLLFDDAGRPKPAAAAWIDGLR